MASSAVGEKRVEGELKPLIPQENPSAAQDRDGKGKGILLQEQACLDRRMMLVGDTGKAGDEEEDEYAFEDDDEAKQMPKRWMAIARFYSGKAYSTWGMFNELSTIWGKQEQIPVRELGNNRFLVEFDSEKLWSRVVGGGPWKHKRDAVIFVPYDGIRRFSDVVINSIALWVRIYDIPETMMTDGFARALGANLGRVLEVGQAIQNYKRVKVDFPLEKAIQYTVEKKVRGYGLLSFSVKYENIPDFCFGCGRIGHDKDECPDEDCGGDGNNFGKALRCSPQKKNVGRRITIPADSSFARRGLNFSGDQHRKVMSATGSSNGTQRGRDSMFARKRDWGAEDQGHILEVNHSKTLAPEYSEELVAGVSKMAVDTQVPDLNLQVPESGKDKVSGLDSFVESSDTSGSFLPGGDAGDRISMHQRFMRSKVRKVEASGEKKFQLGVGSSTRDIEKQKKPKFVAHANIIESIKDLEKNRLSSENVLPEIKVEDERAMVGMSPAKRTRLSPARVTHLTGAQAEPRQEQ